MLFLRVFWPPTLAPYQHKCVLIGKTHLCFAKHIFVLQNTFVFFLSVGHVCQIHFRKDTKNLKNEIGFFNIGDFKKIWNHAKTIFCASSVLPPPIFPIQCLAGMDGVGHHAPPSHHKRIPQDLLVIKIPILTWFNLTHFFTFCKKRRGTTTNWCV